MWSGPRNLSTALMRSFENREDTDVWDEPLYAYYLNKTNLKHPMSEEIIQNYQTNINNLIIDMIKNNKNKIKYLKQMTHHILDETPIDWINKTTNCFLIRKPIKVISSYIKKNELKNSNDIGFPAQYKLFKYLKKNKYKIIIVNADDLIKNPNLILRDLCLKLNIKFDDKMLSWPKGYRKSDGIWGKIWYKKVINSNSFINENETNELKIPSKYDKILNECNEIYENLNLYRSK
tara:strand:- start:665 stop:1366 length:702 start_codon:yes stop_codon:yes gene_type:complete